MYQLDKSEALKLLAENEKGKKKLFSNITPLSLPNGLFLCSHDNGYLALLKPAETAGVSILWLQCYVQLEESLAHFQSWVSGLGSQKIVVEVLGRGSTSAGAIQSINALGFSFHDRLIRMGISRWHTEIYAPNFLRQCSLVDLPHVVRALTKNFDPLMERLPPVKEIEAAIERHDLFVAFDGENLQGMYWGEVTSARGELKFIVVDQAARGLGIGQALLSHFLNRASACARVTLWVLSRNEPAIALYKKNGFEIEGHYCDGYIRELW